ncbi:MAG: aspartate-semialdehyde dehydrogenase [Archangiaceae bacterium]|nr:aspartate-semialdehyde dehydrogenase [Archangiaceae bacterium]
MIAVVGATGVLGTQLVAALNDEGHPVEELTLFASERSHGKEIEVGDETLAIEPTDFRGVKLALVATPLAVSKGIIDEARKAGARVVDFSGAFRADRSVPMVVPGVSPKPGDAPVIGVAGAAGAALATVLAPLHRAAKVAWADVTGLYGAASRGNPGLDLLEQQVPQLLSGRGSEGNGPFAHTLAFNVFPQVGSFAKGHPQSSEELAAALDVARAFEGVGPVRLTALHVPVFHGVMFCVHAQLESPLEAEAARAALKAQPQVKVLDQPDEAIYPTALLTAQDDAVHVGRVRTAGNHLWLVAAVDGAALVARAAVRMALALD